MTAEPLRRYEHDGYPPVAGEPARTARRRPGTAGARAGEDAPRRTPARPRRTPTTTTSRSATAGSPPRSGTPSGSRSATSSVPRSGAVSGSRSGTVTAPRPARTPPAAPKRAVPAPRRAPANRTAAPPAPVAAPRAPFVFLVLGIVAAGIVGLLVLNTAINTSSFAVQQLRDRQNTLDSQEQQLKRDLANRQSPGNLQAAATRMGLVPAGTAAFIRLPDGKIIGVPQPAPANSDPAR